MAAPIDPRLSPNATEPNQIEWTPLRVYMEEHFRSFPDTTVRIFDNVESSDICPFILQYKICPSLFSDTTCCALYHPEFIVRHDEIQWMPRTWVCRAFQRTINPDGSGVTNCPIEQCHYAHAGQWSTAEQLAFRALALRTHHHNMGLLYHLQPTEWVIVSLKNTRSRGQLPGSKQQCSNTTTGCVAKQKSPVWWQTAQIIRLPSSGGFKKHVFTTSTYGKWTNLTTYIFSNGSFNHQLDTDHQPKTIIPTPSCH